MSIEVSSVSDARRRIMPDFRRLFRAPERSPYQLWLQLLFITALVVLSLSVYTVLQSYIFYSQIIDARLTRGYLTSRPGLYAAPRVLQPGQQLSRDKVITILRRAGYLESTASDVWSGSFESKSDSIDIRPSHTNKLQPKLVRVDVTDSTINALHADGIQIDSFTLEPEILSNDLSSKAGRREALNYSELPANLVHAILSIEDRRFFDHAGVDLSGLARALFRNAGDEKLAQGGSTITQQLVKNTYLTSEKTLRRKYAEAMLAIALERRLSKEDIFALYCNEIYLGQRGAVAVRGMKEAADVYFGKQLKDLSLAEAATLAGMIQGPGRYSPVRHAELAKERRNIVLASMYRDGWINSDQVTSAASQPITISANSDLENSLAPYFVDYVNRMSEAEFDSSGETQRIYTTIDLELQQAAEQALRNQLDRLDPIYKSDGQKPQAALVAIDPHNGDILAMVGGRGYAESQLNRATDAKRQPGSTFKPFVYATALEDGMSPVQTFLDAPREFTYDRNKIYKPANYGGGYTMGDVTLRTGLVKSLNVVTVDIALQTGLARIANLATRFGLPKPERYPALALGTEEVTPLQLASAYSVFVNGGRRVEPRAIASVGEAPGEHALLNETEVVNPTTAYMITNMLSAVIDHGTARKARGAIKGSAVAGKTGTSRDGWFVGYTPNLVCAVWIGFDDNKQLGLTGAEAALPAWVDFMNAALRVRPDLGGQHFECPEGIKFVEIDSSTGLLSTLSCPLRELIAVTDRTAPNMECYLHGNVPMPTSPFADETQEQSGNRSSRQEQAQVQMRTSVSTVNNRATRTNVDSNGRRSLVNDLR
jgi:penicillin-binding protein 1B